MALNKPISPPTAKDKFINAGFNGYVSKPIDKKMLDDAINKYTNAMKLAKECSDSLKSAEENVNKILTENGEEDFKVEE